MCKNYSQQNNLFAIHDPLKKNVHGMACVSDE